jgi:penicillin V acylase-like amidase (Ntn superfamily)
MKTMKPTFDRLSNPHSLLNALTAATITLVCLAPRAAYTCTDFMLPPYTESGVSTTTEQAASVLGNAYNNAVSARTMDFTFNLDWYLENQKKATVVQSTNPPKMSGYRWVSEYNLVGFGGMPDPIRKNGQYLDGMNEKGLSAALLWLEKTWPETGSNGFPDPKVGANNVSNLYLVNYLLSKCGSVQCAINFLSDPKTVIWGEAMRWGEMEIHSAVHLVIHDRYNNTAIVEWYDKQKHIHWDPSPIPKPGSPNAIRVLTNDPEFSKQVQAASNINFAKLNKTNHFKITSGGREDEDITLFGDNYLPGDTSSGSRFIRTFKLNKTITADANYYQPLPQNPEDPVTRQYPPLWRVELANRIIARSEEVYGEYHVQYWGIPSYFHTQFTVIRDHSNLNLYLRGIYNSSLRRINLPKLFQNPGNYLKLYVDATPGTYNIPNYQDVDGLFSSKLPPQKDWP